MKKALGLSFLLAFAAHAQQGQPNIEAGKAKVAEVCSACHGLNGVSVSDTIPNLAGQRAAYIENQLKAFKDGTRKNPNPANPTAIMNAMASQLSPAQMTDVAAYFASLPGPASGTKSEFLPHVAKSRVMFPEGYQQSFVKYHAINFPAAKQVRYYYANPAAIQAAREGKPVTGADGFYIADKQLLYTAMGTGAGWGNDIPEALRNGNWNYGIFTLEKQHRPINQAECLACHKPLDATSFVFTLKQIAESK